jgi:inner membrane protein involved in colicin E2 resistance
MRVLLIFGFALILAGGMTVYLALQEIQSLGFLAAYLLSLPALAAVIAGYSLITHSSLRQLLDWLIALIVIALIPWIFVASLGLQILAGSLLIALMVISLYWLNRKQKTRSTKSFEKSQPNETIR